MKKILLIALLAFGINAKAQITFQRTYELGGCEGATAIQQTEDNEFIVAGYTNGNMFFMKINSIGDTLWIKKIIGSNGYAYSVKQTKDLGYIVSGFTDDLGSGGRDILLVKADTSGNIIWSKTFGGINYDDGGYLQQTNDDGFIIAGSTNSFGAGGIDIYLIKTDSIGNALWTKTFGGTGDEYGYFVNQTSDGGYIVTGGTQGFGAGSSDVYLIKTDASGNLIWSKTFGGTGWDIGNSVQQTMDDGYIITGCTSSFGFTNTCTYLIKTDTSGNLLWSKIYSDTVTSTAYAVQQTPDRGFIIGGTGFGSGGNGPYLIKTDSLGNILWSQTYGGINGRYGYCIDQTSDGGYILGGYGVYATQVTYLIKTNSYGNSGCEPTHPKINTISPSTQVSSPATITSQGDSITSPHLIVTGGAIINILCPTALINEFDSNSDLNIYPNPSNHSLTIESPQQATIEITNIQGQLIETLATTGNKTTIDVSSLAKGMYFIKVKTEKGVAVKKVIKE